MFGLIQFADNRQCKRRQGNTRLIAGSEPVQVLRYAPVHQVLAMIQLGRLNLPSLHDLPAASYATAAWCSMTDVKATEIRRKPRRRVLEIGLIRFGEHSVACVLRNFSDIGAALDIGVKDFVPDRFTLIVVPKQKIISCNVIWCRGARIGVSFC
jgi:hypothetical protein